MRDEIENKMRNDPDADGSTEQRAAQSEFDHEPRDERRANASGDGMGIGHVREMNVGHAPHGSFSSGSLNTQVVESDPGQFHRLDRDEHGRERYGRESPLDHESCRSMIGRKHFS